MKPTVNGVLSFGLVSVPVGVAPSTTSTNEPSFRNLHEFCKHPVSIRTTESEAKKEEVTKVESNGGTGRSLVWCDVCNRAVDDLVKGYEYAKGEFVYFTEDELSALKPERAPTITLRKFVKVGAVLPPMIEKHYFLLPNQNLAESYGLLYQALAELKAVGIGVQTLWGKEHPCAVVASSNYESGGVMMMQTLYTHDDLRLPDFSAAIPSREAKKLAKELITASIEEFDPVKDLRSDSRHHLQEVIAAKIQGKEIPVVSEEDARERVPDIQEALKREIEARKKVKV